MGVTLYDLKKMRQSPVYQDQVLVSKMKELAEEFMFVGNLAVQDWFTLLGWKHPQLFHPLPCQYNVQTSQGYTSSEEFSEIWDQYTKCQGRPKIIHENGSW